MQSPGQCFGGKRRSAGPTPNVWPEVASEVLLESMVALERSGKAPAAGILRVIVEWVRKGAVCVLLVKWEGYSACRYDYICRELVRRSGKCVASMQADFLLGYSLIGSEGERKGR
jgi:hypothetical protein